MKFLRLLICVCILLIADQTVYSAQEKWIFINQDQGVTMHSRKVAARAESEFRGSSTIDQPVQNGSMPEGILEATCRMRVAKRPYSVPW